MQKGQKEYCLYFSQHNISFLHTISHYLSLVVPLELVYAMFGARINYNTKTNGILNSLSHVHLQRTENFPKQNFLQLILAPNKAFAFLEIPQKIN